MKYSNSFVVSRIQQFWAGLDFTELAKAFIFHKHPHKERFYTLTHLLSITSKGAETVTFFVLLFSSTSTEIPSYLHVFCVSWVG